MITSEFGRTEDMYTFVLKPVTMDILVAVNHCESPSWLDHLPLEDSLSSSTLG